MHCQSAFWSKACVYTCTCMVFSLPNLPTIVSWDIKSKLKILVWFMQSLTLYKCTCVPSLRRPQSCLGLPSDGAVPVRGGWGPTGGGHCPSEDRGVSLWDGQLSWGSLTSKQTLGDLKTTRSVVTYCMYVCTLLLDFFLRHLLPEVCEAATGIVVRWFVYDIIWVCLPSCHSTALQHG